MRIEVMNRFQAENRSKIERHENKVIISIFTPTDTPANIDENNPTVLDVLYLSFVDCDDSDKQSYSKNWLFNYWQAYQIYEFVMIYKDIVDSIWIHCDGGVSRSAGVAAAILKALTGDDSQIFDNKNYYPNMLVYTITLDVFIEELEELNNS
jgi:predicted protein tyrosine phosphatase